MAHALKLALDPRDVRIRVVGQFVREGSVIQGNARTRCERVEVALSLTSDLPPERLAHLVRMAEASCYTMAALRDPVPASLAVTLNGAPFDPGLA